MIRFFLSYFAAMLILGVCWHQALNVWELTWAERVK